MPVTCLLAPPQFMSIWFRKFIHRKDSKLRLFCFPYAGGNANVFSSWAKYLPDHVDLFALESPGRGPRFSEKPIACLKTKVQILRQEIKAFCDLPYIFVGHSLGALLSFELARELQNRGDGNLKHIVLSAKRAPHLPNIKEAIHQLPQKEFVKQLEKFNFTPHEVIQNHELMEVVSPMLRADFSLNETHDFENTMNLRSDATIFWGNQDKIVPFEDTLAWKNLIDGHVDLVTFNDGHFFISNQEEKFLDEINKIIYRQLRKAHVEVSGSILTS
ncbi:MAG: alpha/beta fold hydrolase [Desulfobacterium sp.]